MAAFIRVEIGHKGTITESVGDDIQQYVLNEYICFLCFEFSNALSIRMHTYSKCARCACLTCSLQASYREFQKIGSWLCPAIRCTHAHENLLITCLHFRCSRSIDSSKMAKQSKRVRADVSILHAPICFAMHAKNRFCCGGRLMCGPASEQWTVLGLCAP
jgi:hypothetical protein